MPDDHRTSLARIKRIDQLVAYLRDELDWPIPRDAFEDADEYFFEFTPEELGIDARNAAKIEEIKRLRPLCASQPWGIFFVKFEPKRLPVVALRRILSQVAIKKRASSNHSERTAWSPDDLLFVSSYGQGDERRIALAHFAAAEEPADLPALKVLAWDDQDTPLRLNEVARTLQQKLAWPEDETNVARWRQTWRSAFSLGHREVIQTARDLPLKLAELARHIRERIKEGLAIEAANGPLTSLMHAFKISLIHDLDADQFADTYAQTIAYGLLSGRMVDPGRKSTDDLVANLRTSPFLRELMETFLRLGGRKGNAGQPGLDFDELGVRDVIDLLDRSNLEAVMKDFGDRNRQEDPVMHFFEGFLQAYDKKIRKDRGVFYTPQPVVSYIVRSVHELLQTEFGLEHGLADTTTWGEMLKHHPSLRLPPLTDEPGETHTISPDESFVQILDPATGTATFIVEVIDVIYNHLLARWKSNRHAPLFSSFHPQLSSFEVFWNAYVPKGLLPRLHAYELMMAPYAIAHMKIGLKLAETGYHFATEERARIYLTNALEPWVKQLPLLGFDALAHEAAAVNEIKRHKRFTVVIGNPPYSKLSSNLTAPVRALVESYKYFDSVRIKERGALQFEMNLQDDYIKFFRLSELSIRIANTGVTGLICNRGFLDNPTLRGMRWSLTRTYSSISVLDLRGHQATIETGVPDENVFSDIKQGTAITIAVRSLSKNSMPAEIYFTSFLGPRAKKHQLLSRLSASNVNKEQLRNQSHLLNFVPTNSGLKHEFEDMISLTDIFPRNSAGFISSRDGLVIGENKNKLEKAITAFGNDTDNELVIYERYGFGPSKRLDLSTAQRAVRHDNNVASNIRRCLYRPFDQRWVYYKRELIESFKPIAFNFSVRGNIALLATRQVTRSAYEHAFVSRCMSEIKICSHDRNTQIFPLFLQSSEDELAFSSRTIPNLDQVFMARLAKALGLKLNASCRDLGRDDELSPLQIFHFAYAILHSPSYRDRYFEFLRSDFPRLPLTGNLELFRELARLGGELVALHLLESPRLEMPRTRFIGHSREVVKVGWVDDTVWLDAGGKKAATTPGTSGFRGVPEAVWNFHIGGYQVCEKWLKDRKGRVLSDEDIAHYQKIVVALGETIRLMADIDDVINAHGGWPAAFRNDAVYREEAVALPRAAENEGDYGRSEPEST